MKKVLVIGSGGVGTIAALSLYLNGKAEVTMVVRSAYDQMVEHGFTINSADYGTFPNWRPHNVARNVEDAASKYGPFDYIVLTTKNIPDGPIKCEDIIRPAVTADSVILLLQNGLGIEEPMMEQFPNNILLSGITLIASSYKNGVVENPGKDHVSVGDFRKPHGCSLPGTEDAINGYIEIYRNEDPSLNHIDIDPDCRVTRWQKLVYNSVFNVITAISDLDVSRLQLAGLNNSLVRPAMREVYAIAKSEGVEIPESAMERFIHIGDGMFYAPSMCVDQRKNQLMEMEVILGNPLRIATKNNVPVPILSVLYQLLKLVQFKIRESHGLIKIDPKDYQYNSDDYPIL